VTSARRTKLYASLLVMAASAPPANALPPVPYNEIVDTVRVLAAELLERKPEDVDTARSLAAQGMNEKMLRALVVELQQEFAVVIPDEELRLGRWADPVVGLTVRRLAQLVDRQMKEPH
jgi:acyl carrier protein